MLLVSLQTAFRTILLYHSKRKCKEYQRIYEKWNFFFLKHLYKQKCNNCSEESSKTETKYNPSILLFRDMHGKCIRRDKMMQCHDLNSWFFRMHSFETNFLILSFFAYNIGQNFIGFSKTLK
ncbi:hypothetical protein Gasu2_37810 [Galdieria sulphuraria]|nr:hypothetical protein Gasu2_37810 [Galdieria sulphuraria]